jgi:hypothetical protein
MTFEQIQLRDSIPLDIITAEQWRDAIHALWCKQSYASHMNRLVNEARMIALKVANDGVKS